MTGFPDVYRSQFPYACGPGIPAIVYHAATWIRESVQSGNARQVGGAGFIAKYGKGPDSLNLVLCLAEVALAVAVVVDVVGHVAEDRGAGQRVVGAATEVDAAAQVGGVVDDQAAVVDQRAGLDRHVDDAALEAAVPGESATGRNYGTTPEADVVDAAAFVAAVSGESVVLSAQGAVVVDRAAVFASIAEERTVGDAGEDVVLDGAGVLAGGA